MYYLGTKKQCEDYNSTVFIGEAYSASTIQWDDIKINNTEDEYAIIKHEKYTHKSMTLVDELPNAFLSEL